jgi:hypothetical protein
MVQVHQDEWQGYMTVLAINCGIMKSIGIFTAGIHPMIKSGVDALHNSFHQGRTVDAGHSLAAFDCLCVGIGLHTPPSKHSASGKRYLLSARRESMDLKRSASDSQLWRS